MITSPLDMHEQILAAAAPLFLGHGIRDVTVEQVQGAAGVSGWEFDQEFSSRDDLQIECMGRREQEWAAGILEAGARARGTTAEGCLLAMFDVFEDWFRRDDYEALTFVNVLLEMGNEHPTVRARVGYLFNIRSLVANLAAEGHLRNPIEFSLSWHVLMRGSIMNAVEGDRKAASRAKAMAADLIARHRPPAVAQPLLASELDSFDLDTFDLDEVA